MNSFLVPGLVLTWVVVLGSCWFGWQLLRQNGRMLLRIEALEKRLDQSEFGEASEPSGLPIDSVAPEFELPDLAGERVSLSRFRGQPLLLIFFNPACGFCRELAAKLAALPPQPAPPVGAGESGRSPAQGTPLVLVVSTGEAENNRKLFTEHKVACPVLLQKEMEVAAPYKAHGTPTGYLINPDGKIASELTVGGEALLALARPQGPALAGRFSNRSLARSKIKRDGLKAGTLAPDFRLPRLDGGELSLKELRGRRVLLVFSDPECGPCNALAPQLEKFYRETGRHSRPPSPGGEEAPAPALELVMISRREPKENRAKVKEHGLTFPLVLQQHWEISRTYAMFATPMAYFIDEAGIIAHDVAVGVEPILALMAMAGRMPVETPSNAS